ncbi:transcription-repair coupling factor [Paramagnetospirillum caucaseum]|uniref:Transcription-repair-coupling factor n=1 Tax=Paramagnetospirillum caucaseum TaxID=1244869 RepID=M2ZTZ3_9PROT|nr:transcription-repair coupling factor [Paramagnetospirillum caucaseum]EME70842.1 transcription-repair coupling factor [Paramagnetospirillum caucaseum]
MDNLIAEPGRHKVAGAPEGRDALLLAELAAGTEGGILHVARDEGRMARVAEALAFFAPELTVLEFPGWDCVPYDRVSPHVDMVARRIDTLARLADGVKGAFVVLTTVPALAQRVPPREALASATLDARKGSALSMDKLIGFLAKNGYVRADTVMEPGEYAVRGGIVDLFPPGSGEPLRLDFFGDEIESVRSFDPMSQRTTGVVEGFVCRPVSEVGLDEASIARFRAHYREMFGVVQGPDPLYEAISEGIKFNGMEHWLPLFHDGLDTLFAYVPEAAVVLDHQSDEALSARHALVLEYFDARAGLSGSGLTESGMVYHPIPPERLYLERQEWDRLLGMCPVLHLSPFDPAEDGSLDAGGRLGRDFADMRARPGINVYDCVREHAEEQAKAGRRMVIAAWTQGSRDRLAGVLKDHGIKGIETVDSWAEAQALDKGRVAVAILGLDHGFTTSQLALVTEQDILGDRLARPARKKKKGAQFIAEASALSEGDLVVHVEHGIGRYDGLVALEVSGAPHDCLRVIYDGGDKLFVPVENIDVLTRFGSEQAGVSLDKLGGTAWQARKAKLKKRIRDIADQLIGIAAQRQMRRGEALVPAEGLYDEFCARFPFAETDDQLRAIEDCIADLASGRPMDRLICGDVGFGKTEVAMRVAFVAALQGLQVAVVVPTTLLARQHYRTFKERFAGLPVRVEQLSRLVTAKTASEVKAGVTDGSVDIVIGTHALLAKGIGFKRLGLLIIDEEQHFGVAHKERLKQLKSDVHVLTLTATPIPRTLQMALSGVKEMSVIATPPVDRLAVRTFVLPYDPVVLRESILRERYRGGQVFYVCPRLADIDRVAERLAKLVPEVKTAVAHGRLAPADLEEVMVAFGDKQYDVLLSTNIIESGIDMPSVNTLIIHRADMFGLGQLYQLRGRVGRGKTRGYAYFTLPNDKVLSKAAEKRLQVMQALDTLGAGFQLASHDLDIRGAGNLLGEEQSGHIREVGIELYQQLLEEAVAAAKGGQGGEAAEEWSPQIAVGTPVLIPETYVADLSVRLSLYRRIGSLADQAEIEALAAELIDRFGKLPPEVENLLEVVAIKALCKLAGIDKVDSGPKGAVVSLRGNVFTNPAALVQFIARSAGSCKIRPDHKIVFLRAWEDPKQRITGLRNVIGKLAELASA